MMPQRNPPCSEMEQSEHDLTPIHCSVDCASNVAMTRAEPGQSNEDTASSSPESVSLNGEGKRSGKNRRRRKRSSAHPESCPPAEEEGKGRGEEELGSHDNPAPDSGTALLGLRSEYASVWLDRSAYEQAESFYQCWLARTTNRPAKPSESPLPPGNLPTPGASVSLVPLACGHADHVACHHVVQDVWVNKPSFDQAERRSAEESQQLTVPSSLAVPSNHPAAATPATPDEGYQSQAPTPATPTAGPSPRQPINGLPRIPLELLGDVWLEKPLYDRAEAAFYQKLYGSNNLGAVNSRACHPNSPSTSRSSDHHPQSLVEEEEEEDEEEEPGAVVVPQGKAEVFHALHPIQEEEEPADVTEEDDASSVGGAATTCYFLHPDSERVWLDKWRYEAAESRFHAAAAAAATEVERPTSPVACSSPLRDNAMSAVDFLGQEKIWFDKPRYDDAERHYYESMNGPSHSAQEMGANSILQDIARARENIQKSLAGSTGGVAGDQGELVSRIRGLELENQNLHKVVEDLRSALSKLECRVAVLEESPVKAEAPVAAPPYTNGTTVQPKKASAPVEEEDDDDDIDLFGSDEEEDMEAERIKEQRLKEYAEKKAKKPALIAKSSILLDVKPWDDETDMAKLEECVRSVQADGLLWGSSKLVAVGYGIKKLQIQCVVVDDKVGTDMLEEEITKFEDYVQSVDVAAFNKI